MGLKKIFAIPIFEARTVTDPFIMKISIHRLRMLLYTHINNIRTENKSLNIEQKIQIHAMHYHFN